MEKPESNLLQAVLALPAAERAVFADAILSSLDDEDVSELHDDDALEQELLRRSAEMDEDPSASVPWSELKKLR